MVGLGVNGIPSTKLGGIASQRRVYGPRQNTFRFYRIQFTDNERNRAEDAYQGEIQNVQYLHMQDKQDGENLLFNNKVTLTSNFFSKSTMSAWLTNIQLEDSTVMDRLYLTAGNNPFIAVDFKYPQFLHSYSIAVEFMYSGWRLLGSHDGVVWHYLQDVTPEAALDSVYPTTFNVYATRFQFSALHGKPLQANQDANYLRWGIITYNEGDALDNSKIYTVEFRDGVGGINLCTGGSADKWASTLYLPGTEIFDGNDNTFWALQHNTGAGYLFTNPVNPVTVAIRSGPDDNDTPNAFHVISSNNGKVWYYRKYFETPEGTWPSGLVTTQEFIL